MWIHTFANYVILAASVHTLIAILRFSLSQLTFRDSHTPTHCVGVCQPRFTGSVDDRVARHRTDVLNLSYRALDYYHTRSSGSHPRKHSYLQESSRLLTLSCLSQPASL